MVDAKVKKSNLYNNILLLGMGAIMVFSPAARGAVRIWSVTPVLLAIYALVFLWLWRGAGRGRAVLAERSTLDLPISLFALLALASFIFSISKHESFFALLRLFAYIGVYYLLVNNFDREMFRKLLGLAVVTASCLSAYGILQYFGVLKHTWWVPEEFMASTYVNHNHFAGYLELAIPLAVGLLFSRQSRRIKAFLIAALAVMAAAFIIAQSRGAWICLGLALLTMNILFIKKGISKRSSLVIFLLGIAVIFSVAYLKEGMVARRLDTIKEAAISKESREASFKTRLLIWQGALGMIRSRPLLGVGIGDFDLGFYRYRPKGLDTRAVYAHNDYLHMAAEMGVSAPLIMLWIFGLLIHRGFKKENSPRVIGAAAGTLGLALHGLLDFNFHIPANMLLLTVLAAYITSCAGTAKTKDKP